MCKPLPVSKETRVLVTRIPRLTINAHTIRAEHELEVMRIESEAFVAAMSRKLRAADVI